MHDYANENCKEHQEDAECWSKSQSDMIRALQTSCNQTTQET